MIAIAFADRPMPTGSEIPASHATLYRLALASIGIGVLVLGFKFLAWRLTGSVALYSGALESITNVAPAIATFVPLRVRSMPVAVPIGRASCRERRGR